MPNITYKTAAIMVPAATKTSRNNFRRLSGPHLGPLSRLVSHVSLFGVAVIAGVFSPIKGRVRVRENGLYDDVFCMTLAGMRIFLIHEPVATPLASADCDTPFLMSLWVLLALGAMTI